MDGPTNTELLQKPDLTDSDETTVRLLRNFEDSDFRKYIPMLMENAPTAVRTINEDYKHTGKDKYSHTQQTLQLLETANLSEANRFIARAGTMFHDTNPGKAIDDLCRWVKSGLVTNTEAVNVMKQVWWHDLLGVDINHAGVDTNQLPYVIPNDEDRMVNIAIFEADIKSYGLAEQYRDLLPQARQLQHRERNLVDLSALSTEEVIAKNPKLSVPQDNDIFIHGIFTRNDTATYSEITPLALMSMLTSDALKSSGLITTLENQKTTKASIRGKVTDNELNVFRFQPGNFPQEIGAFGQDDANWLTIVYFGRDIKDECLVKPLESAENQSYVAGLVNKFDANGNIRGCELSMKNAYYIIKADAAQSLIPILKLEALRLGKDPEEWVQERVIIHDWGSPEELVTQLQSGELSIKDHNVEALLHNLEYHGFTKEGALRNNFDIVIQNGGTRKHFDPPQDDDFKCQILHYEDLHGNFVAERLTNYLKAFPWLIDNPQVKALAEQMVHDSQIRMDILNKVQDNNGNYYDEATHTLYIEGQFRAVVAIPDVQSYSRDIKNEGNKFAERNTWNITLNNGNTLNITKGPFDYF